MSFSYEVYKSQRIIPLRFLRSITGAPVIGKPDVDDHGYYRTTVTLNNDHGHVIGITEGKESEVKIKRERIDNKAALFVTSSDTAKMTVTASGGTNALPTAGEAIIKIKGIKAIAGANPNTAKAEIRYGSATGPIVGEISVWVFKNIDVKLTPHNHKIKTATAAGIDSRVNVTAVMDMVKAFWEPCGINFLVDPVITAPDLTFATAGDVQWGAEFNSLLNTAFVAKSINAYFVNRIVIPPTATVNLNGVLGFGASRASFAGFGLPNPGILLGDKNVSGDDRHTDTHWLANDLAHEVGHFFTLEHVDRKNNNAPRDDTWSVRRLMYPGNTRGNLPGAWQNDVGYGPNYRGALITNKNLTDAANAANHSTDGESLIARGVAAATPNGPY